MNRLFAPLIAVLAGSVALCAAPDGPAFTVNVTGGRIMGTARTAGALFAGIPYAQPPVGARRWQPPQPVVAWSGVRAASEAGPSALQPDLGWNSAQRVRQSEDCLYLNVLTAEWPAKGKRPVLVYVHGGGNVGGNGWDHLLTHTTLPEQGVVLVSLNYRLGVFGFLAHPELTAESAQHASGNYGLMDQMAALKWVRENISEFGGDPTNVTVMGQSAGAQDIGLLLASPLARGLITKAILESGPVVGVGPQAGTRYAGLADAEKNGANLVRKLGVPDLAALRAMPAEELVTAAAKAQIQVGPVIDGWVLRDSPGKTFAEGHALPVPVLLGSNAREFPFGGGLAELRKAISGIFGEHAAQALQLYGISAGEKLPAADPVYGDVGAQFGADLVFRVPTEFVALWQAAAGVPVWRYQFSRTPIGHEAAGAAHSAELPYVFGEMVPNELGADYNAADRALSSAIQHYWVNFATSGDPNGEGLPAWPRYDSVKRSYVNFAEQGPKAEAGLRREWVDLYLKLSPSTSAP